MAEEISSIIASARAKLQAELDVHLNAVADQHRQTLELARRTAEQDAEDRWLTKLRTAEESARAAGEAAAAAASRRARDTIEETLATIKRIESANTVSETLNAIAHGVSAGGSRSALFILEGDQLVEWTATGAQPVTRLPIRLEDPSAGVLSAAIRNRVIARDVAPAAVGASGAERTAAAIPLLLEGVAVALVYADEAGAAPEAAVLGTLELIAAHGATRLGYLTAVRTAQAMRWIADGAAALSSPATAVPTASSSDEEEEQSAKRYARLLISEIKLYNEAAVRTGREQRDLLKRLQPEVERARRLYEHRVPATLRGRAQHFDHELVQTLAGGDALLLG